MNKYILIIFVMALVTYSTRALPFIIWGNKQNRLPFIQYLGNTLPYAMMGLLIVYSFKNVSFVVYPFGISEIIASSCCIGLHLWKRNTLISISCSTILYMFLVQVVF